MRPALVWGRLAVGRVARVPVPRLDHVRVQRPLRQEVRVREVGAGVLEHIDKALPDALALLLGVIDPRQLAQEQLRRVRDPQVDLEMVAEGRLDQPPLALAQQPVVHEHARELVPDRLVQQHRRHRRVHPARQPADHPLVAHLPADVLAGAVREVAHAPVPLGAADLVQEVPDQVDPVGRVRDLGVELHADERGRRPGLVLTAA